MRVVYVDSNNHCHVANDGSMTPVETGYFYGKCDTYIEGYCMEVNDGCMAFYPWMSYSELDAAQRQYEQEQLADMRQALEILGVVV